ncbi:hypothetical protein FQZ97_840810 [compost metagenome]
MQALVVDAELLLQCLALLAVEILDALLALEYGVACREHGVGVGTQHVQRAAGQFCDVVPVADDAGMQDAVFDITVAHVDGGENGATAPGCGGFHHQDRAGAIAQQFPVLRGEDRFHDGVVGPVLLDHQSAALRLLRCDDGLVCAVVPGLLGADAEPLLFQCPSQVLEVRRQVRVLVANQQMQVRLGGVGDHSGPVQDQGFRLLRIHYHQGVADGMHGCIPEHEFGFFVDGGTVLLRCVPASATGATVARPCRSVRRLEAIHRYLARDSRNQDSSSHSDVNCLHRSGVDDHGTSSGRSCNCGSSFHSAGVVAPLHLHREAGAMPCTSGPAPTKRLLPRPGFRVNPWRPGRYAKTLRSSTTDGVLCGAHYCKRRTSE